MLITAKEFELELYILNMQDLVAINLSNISKGLQLNSNDLQKPTCVITSRYHKKCINQHQFISITGIPNNKLII